jgi:hypothetical protein
VDGDLKEPKLPLIPGHQIVGKVVEIGGPAEEGKFKVGDRVGVPWLGWSCGNCKFCTSEAENLCDYARYTGYQIDGGFAQYCIEAMSASALKFRKYSISMQRRSLRWYDRLPFPSNDRRPAHGFLWFMPLPISLQVAKHEDVGFTHYTKIG